MKKIFLVLILICFSFFIACNKTDFKGTRIAESYIYQLDIEKMNGTDTHKMNLDANDILNIHFKTTLGKINLSIIAPDGSTFYSGNGLNLTLFKLNIKEKGEYTIVVKAKNAKGNIKINLIEEK